MTMKTRFRRLVAVFGAFLAASVSMLGLGLATSQQVAGAAVSAGDLSLASGVQPEVWPQNTKASVVVNGNTVTTAVGQLPGWIFSLPDNWTAGSEITITAAPASGANCSTPVPYGLNQDQPNPSNYVGFADFMAATPQVPVPAVSTVGGGGTAPNITVSETGAISCADNSNNTNTYSTLVLHFNNNGDANGSTFTVGLGWSFGSNNTNLAEPVTMNTGFGATVGPVIFTATNAGTVQSGLTVSGEAPAANNPRVALTRDSGTDAIGGAISNFTITENTVAALPPHDGSQGTRTIDDASYTIATNAVQSPTAQFTPADLGVAVSGTDVPPNTTITSVIDGENATFSNNFTATNAGTGHIVIGSQFNQHLTIPSHAPGAVCVTIQNHQNSGAILWDDTSPHAWTVAPGASQSGYTAQAGGASVVNGGDTLQLPVVAASNVPSTTWTASGLALTGVSTWDGPVWAYAWWSQSGSCFRQEGPIPQNYILGYVQLASVRELAPAIYGAEAESTAAQAIGHQFNYATGSCVSNAFPNFGAGSSIFLARSNDYHDALGASYAAGTVGSGVLLTPQNSLHPDSASEIRLQGVQTVFVAGGPLAISDAVVTQLQNTPSYFCGGTVPRTDPFTGKLKTLNVVRIYGATAYDTNQQLAQFIGAQPIWSGPAFAAYGTPAFNNTTGTSTPSGPTSVCNTGLLVSGENFQDAVAASVAAYALPMPLITTNPASLSPQAQNAIYNDHICQLILVGGPLAVSNNVVSQLQAGGVSVFRVAGQTASDTSVQLASFQLSAALGLGWDNRDGEWDNYVNRTAGNIHFNENGQVSAHGVLLARGDFYADAMAAASVLSIHNGRYQFGDSILPLVMTDNPTTLGTPVTGFLNQASFALSKLQGAVPAGGWAGSSGWNFNEASSSVFTIQPVGGPLALAGSTLQAAINAIGT